MKVLLVRPPSPNKLSFTKILDTEPLELEYLHTALQEAGYEDIIYDCLVEKASIEDIIKRELPDVVAITGYITHQNVMLKIAKLAKHINPKIHTIVGGVHVQKNYKNFYADSVDYMTRSESLEAFIQLITFLNTGEGEIENINGLCYKNQEGWKVNRLQSVCIDTLPMPDRNHFNKHKGVYRYLDLSEVATVKSAFSCPYACNFCYCTTLNNGKYEARKVEKVVEEIQQIQSQNIQIVDDDFLVDVERLKTFIKLIKEKNIKKTYTAYARADFVVKHKEIVKALVEIGFKYFLVGLEAVSDTELKGYNKQTSVDMNTLCVQTIHEAGGECIGLMIVGIEAGVQDFKKIVNWVKQTKLRYVTVSIFTPIPGTPLYEQYKEQIITTNVEDWDFLHLVLQPTQLKKWQFYVRYYWLTYVLYQIGKKRGAYTFINMKLYQSIIKDYVKRKIRDRKINGI